MRQACHLSSYFLILWFTQRSNPPSLLFVFPPSPIHPSLMSQELQLHVAFFLPNSGWKSETQGLVNTTIVNLFTHVRAIQTRPESFSLSSQMGSNESLNMSKAGFCGQFNGSQFPLLNV